MGPERVLAGQRFISEDVEQHPGKLAGIWYRQQVIIDQMTAPACIDHGKDVCYYKYDVFTMKDTLRSR